MPKSSVAAYGAEGKSNLLLMDPDKLTIVEDDTGSALYDPDRTSLPLDEALVLNIMTYGVIEPAVIRKNPETGAAEVVDGRQRTKACREANKRLKRQGCAPLQIPCIVRRGDPKVLMGVMVSTFIRQEDTALGRARKLARFIDMGNDEAQASVAFGISKATIKNLLALNDAPKAVQKAVESGQVAASVAYSLAKLEPEEQKAKLAEIKMSAPKEPGRKHSSNGKKAREIVTGKSEMLSRKSVKGLLETVEKSERMKEMWRAGAQAALLAVLGDLGPLETLMS